MSPAETQRRSRPGHGARRRQGAYRQGGQSFGFELMVGLMDIVPADFHAAMKAELSRMLNSPEWSGQEPAGESEVEKALIAAAAEDADENQPALPGLQLPEKDLPVKQLSDEPLVVLYANWRGEIALRRILPLKLRFAATEWHPDRQWLLQAYDLDKDAFRDFALADFLGSLARCNQLQSDWLRGMMRELRKSMRDTLVREMDPEDADHLLQTVEPALSELEAKHQPPSKKAPS